jgi:L-alanine-DL-glutamate epimerase-like enolase superfamily enzyme
MYAHDLSQTYGKIWGIGRKRMKITKIDVFPLRVPMRRVVERVHGSTREQNSVLARIWTDEGDAGIGAIDPLESYDEESAEEIPNTLRQALVPLLVGQDPSRIRKIVNDMDAAVPRHLGSKAVLEMALFDLLGRKLKVPVHVLFGGRVRDTILLNGWVGVVSPEQARQEAQEILRMGFRSLKIKINTDLAGAQKRIEAVRSVVQDKVQIRVDANESLNFIQAREAVEMLKPLGVLYLEQPVPRDSVEDFRRLAQTSPVKLMADEGIHDLETLVRFLKSGAAHFVKVKIQKFGGFLKTLQAVQVAEAFGIPVILGHGFGLTVNTLAELHLAASTNAILDGCEAVGPFKMADDVVKTPLVMDKGTISVPHEPGLGVDLDEEKIQKYRTEG